MKFLTIDDASPARRCRALLAALAAAVLSACGGGGGGGGAADTPADPVPQAATVTSLTVDTDQLPAAVARQFVEPTFHVAPIVLDEPDGADAIDNTASTRTLPRVQVVPPAMARVSTRTLTLEGMARARRAIQSGTPSAQDATDVAPEVSNSTVTTYTPAQVRAAYALPGLPAAGVTPTAAQAAQLGAGQTIYIIDAMHDPNISTELATFNQRFGLPTCITRTLGTALPLAPAAASNGCVLSIAYTTAAGALTATPPAYDAGWTIEIALDVQWAHATAPLARIVLIEAPDPSIGSLLGAIQLANTMGPGVVSMSFGANEGSWTATADAAFTGTSMTYLAATGDTGAQVAWPAVSPKVLAVGGTRLSYSGAGPRSEVAWSSGGGGISAYTPVPGYQSIAVPGVGALSHRAVADVSFNADPSTGQMTAVLPRGSSSVSWLSVGGTSLSTPQWAGLIAVANAVRAQSGRPALGSPHAMIYGQIGAVPGTYASAFADIIEGTNGSCASCAAQTGFDTATGLGTPNATSLIAALATSAAPAVAPVVNSASVGGIAGTALSFGTTVSAGNPVTFALAGAPAGLSINAAGTISWPSPLVGAYAVTVTAVDSSTGLSGQGVYTLNIFSAGSAPVISFKPLSGFVGTPLSGSISFSSLSARYVAVSISGGQPGMAFSASGGTVSMTWTAPVAGSYVLQVTAKDPAGLTSQVSVPITIAA